MERRKAHKRAVCAERLSEAEPKHRRRPFHLGQNMKPTNLVFVMSDEHDERVPGCCGHGSISTRPDTKAAYL
jgi:hypothetical protein